MDSANPVRSDDPRRPQALWALAAVCAIQVFFILWSGTHPLSGDEGRYAWAVRQDWSALYAWLRTDNHPPLYLTFLKAWCGLFGSSELAMRSTNLLFAPPLSLLVFLFARRAFGPQRGLALFVAFALNPLLLFLCGIAKYYVPFMLVSFAATYLLWLATQDDQRPSPRWLAAWTLCCALLPWAHYFGIVLLAVCGAYILWRIVAAGDRRMLLPLGLMIVAALTFLPWAWVLATRVTEMGNEAPPGFIGPRRVAIRVVYTVYAFALGPTLELTRVILPAMGLLAAFAGFCRLVTFRWEPAERRTISLLAILGGAPLALALAVMIIKLPGHPDLSMPERVSFVLPALVLLGALGVSRMGRIARVVVICLYAVPAVVSLCNLLAWRENNSWDYLIPWREIAAVVRAEPSRPVVVLTDGWSFGALSEYYVGPPAETFINLRDEEEAGRLADVAARARESGACLYYLRSVRDATSGEYLAQVQAQLDAACGPPLGEQRFVFDSQAMQRLKALVRRGTGSETHEGKLLLLRYRGAKSPP